MNLTLEVLNLDSWNQRLDNLTPRMRQALRIGIDRSTTLLLSYVKLAKLSGQVLNRRTGTLSRSINRRVVDTPEGVEGTVGTNVEYARIHEFGGTVTIKAHMARMTQVFGRKLASPIQVFVQAHAATYPQRSFLRSAYDDKKADIKAEMQMAVAQGVKM